MKFEGNRYEQRSLTVGMWANLLMGVAGVAAAVVSRSDALMVDGLYSGVNFVSAIIAGRVAASVVRKPDRRRPFGYEIDEPLYVLFRSLVLLGILAFAMITSLSKIVTYASGGEVPDLVLGAIAIYTAAMAVLCFGLAAVHSHYWVKTGKRSDILRTERSASIVDGFISAGAGGALLGIALLEGTLLDWVVPIADALVVLVLSLVMIGKPGGTFRGALREVAGAPVDDITSALVRERIEAALENSPCELLHVAVVKSGRSHFVSSYVKPSIPLIVAEIDALRESLHACYADLFPQARSEVVLTAENPWREN